MNKSIKNIYSFIRKNRNQFLIGIALIILVVLVLSPLYFLIIKSFKTITQEQSNPFGFPSPFTLENYIYAWVVVKPYMINSLEISITCTLGTVFVSSLAAFAFIRFKFPYKDTIFLSILALLMIPGVLTLISRYELVNNMNLINNKFGVILPAIAGGLPFCIFLLKTFFEGIPKELFEAAEIDGASNMGVYLKIVLPSSKPIISALVIMQFVGHWNDYLWPSLVLLKEDLQTIPVGLVQFTKDYSIMTGGYGAPFASYIITSIPLLIIFVASSKQFIDGLTSGAFKM